jgi:hypothetical protein
LHVASDPRHRMRIIFLSIIHTSPRTGVFFTTVSHSQGYRAGLMLANTSQSGHALGCVIRYPAVIWTHTQIPPVMRYSLLSNHCFEFLSDLPIKSQSLSLSTVQEIQSEYTIPRLRQALSHSRMANSVWTRMTTTSIKRSNSQKRRYDYSEFSQYRGIYAANSSSCR